MPTLSDFPARRRQKKRHTTFLLWISAAAALGLSITACSSPGGGTAIKGSGEVPASGGHMVVEGSMVKPYVDAAGIAGDATTLLLGEVVSSSVVTIADLEFTRYELTVQEHFAGATPESIPVYQVGAPDWHIGLDVPAHLQKGERYLLFLQPTGVPQGQTGEDGYYIVGPGAWADEGGSQFELWLKPESNVEVGTVPTEIDLDAVPQMLAVDAVGSTR